MTGWPCCSTCFLQAPGTCHALRRGDVRAAVAEHAIDGTAIGTGEGGSAADEGALKTGKCGWLLLGWWKNVDSYWLTCYLAGFEMGEPWPERTAIGRSFVAISRVAVVLICFMQTVSEHFGVMKLFQELLFGCHLLMFISIFVSQSKQHQATLPTMPMKIISRDALSDALEAPSSAVSSTGRLELRRPFGPAGRFGEAVGCFALSRVAHGIHWPAPGIASEMVGNGLPCVVMWGMSCHVSVTFTKRPLVLYWLTNATTTDYTTFITQLEFGRILWLKSFFSFGEHLPLKWQFFLLELQQLLKSAAFLILQPGGTPFSRVGLTGRFLSTESKRWGYWKAFLRTSWHVQICQTATMKLWQDLPTAAMFYSSWPILLDKTLAPLKPPVTS